MKRRKNVGCIERRGACLGLIIILRKKERKGKKRKEKERKKKEKRKKKERKKDSKTKIKRGEGNRKQNNMMLVWIKHNIFSEY